MEAQARFVSDTSFAPDTHSMQQLPALGVLPRLSRAEWDTVSAAFSDARADRPSASRRVLRRLVTLLTGIRAATPLASARLSASHHFVGTTRTQGAPSPRLWPELIARGSNKVQVEALALLSLEERGSLSNGGSASE